VVFSTTKLLSVRVVVMVMMVTMVVDGVGKCRGRKQQRERQND